MRDKIGTLASTRPPRNSDTAREEADFPTLRQKGQQRFDVIDRVGETLKEKVSEYFRGE